MIYALLAALAGWSVTSVMFALYLGRLLQLGAGERRHAAELAADERRELLVRIQHPDSPVTFGAGAASAGRAPVTDTEEDEMARRHELAARAGVMLADRGIDIDPA